jgi:hypothetical protein
MDVIVFLKTFFYSCKMDVSISSPKLVFYFMYNFHCLKLFIFNEKKMFLED